MRAVLAADKHHGETGRTGNRGQLRFAVAALRRVGRNRRAAVRTVESLRLHLFPERACAALHYNFDGADYHENIRSKIAVHPWSQPDRSVRREDLKSNLR